MEVVAPAAVPTGVDWRFQLHPMARKVMVKRIMQALKKHLPIRDSDWLSRFQNIAKGFEQKFYTTAASKSSYLRKIAMLLLYVETLNQNPKHRGNNPAQSSADPLMSQQKTPQGNTSASVQASSLPNPGQSLTNVGQTSVLKNIYSRVHLTISENNVDEKGKAPMPDSPGEESFDQEFWNSTLYPAGSDDEHPGADTEDKFELADPSENTQLMEDTSTVADPVFYEYPGISFGEYQKLSHILEENLNNETMFDGTTNPKKRKIDGASSFEEATSGPMYGHSSFQW